MLCCVRHREILPSDFFGASAPAKRSRVTRRLVAASAALMHRSASARAINPPRVSLTKPGLPGERQDIPLELLHAVYIAGPREHRAIETHFRKPLQAFDDLFIGDDERIAPPSRDEVGLPRSQRLRR